MIFFFRDRSRFEFTHEVLPEKESKFKGKCVLRNRRISIIQRLMPENVQNHD